LHRRRNTLVKERIPPSLQTADIIMAKIKAKTMTETMTKTTTKIATKTTVDLGDVAMSARKRIANHRGIQRWNAIKLRMSTKAALAIELEDSSTTALRNASNSISLTTKETRT
jgi:hypothetical protein